MPLTGEYAARSYPTTPHQQEAVMTDDAMPTYGSFGSKIPPLANDSPELHECDKCGLRTALPPKIVDGVPHYFCSLHCQESVSIRKSTR